MRRRSSPRGPCDQPVTGSLSVAMILGEGLVSMVFFWPRNRILFIEGSAVHSAEVLRQTAAESQRMHWWRLVFNAIGSAAVFTGFLRLYRETLGDAPDRRSRN